MKNKRNIIIVATVIVVLSVGAAVFAFTQNKAASPSMQGMADNKVASSENADSSKSATYKKYAALKGEDYDKAFISNMIVHHDGAINMASVADAATSRQEIRDLAMAITSSQAKEMGDMSAWQKQWDYPETNGHMMVDGGGDAGDSMEGMVMTNNELEGLSGDTFDKKFLELMIIHHQDAIDMSEPAETNAFHQEVKDLAKDIIAAQSKEIEQMEQWQRDWGYTNG